MQVGYAVQLLVSAECIVLSDLGVPGGNGIPIQSLGNQDKLSTFRKKGLTMLVLLSFSCFEPEEATPHQIGTKKIYVSHARKSGCLPRRMPSSSRSCTVMNMYISLSSTF